jgi:histidine triad (HIT) family protein
VNGQAEAALVFEDEVATGFLDRGPLAHGHVLVVPRAHVETLRDLPDPLVGPFFARIKWTVAAVEAAMQADGVFTAMNLRISQSVMHLHVHVVPRWRNDRLFSRNLAWPRHPYRDDEQREEVRARIAAAVSSNPG